MVGRRVGISFEDFRRQLRALYGELARQDPQRNGDPAAPARVLQRLLIEPLTPDLQRLGITTLILVPTPACRRCPSPPSTTAR